MPRTMPRRRKNENLELPNKMRYGRLILNADIYPCMKRSCVALDAVRKSRIGLLQIKGPEHIAHMKAYDAGTPDGKVDLIYDRLEQLLDTSAQIAGLTQGQYRDWGTLEFFETGPMSGRSLSKRMKNDKKGMRKTRKRAKHIETGEENRTRKRRKETHAKRDAGKQEKRKRRKAGKTGKKRVSELRAKELPRR